MATVLLVDDDVGVRKITATVLALSGHDVCDAADGMEALAILAERQIDLMVLDLAMPVMDGWETYREARREGYLGPIVILSAYGAHAAGRELGAEGALSKPFDPDDLESLCLSILRERTRISPV
jgi:CheY-like chemotaxis protein